MVQEVQFFILSLVTGAVVVTAVTDKEHSFVTKARDDPLATINEGGVTSEPKTLSDSYTQPTGLHKPKTHFPLLSRWHDIGSKLRGGLQFKSSTKTPETYVKQEQGANPFPSHLQNGPENVSGKSPQQDIEIPNVPSLKSPEDVSDAYLQKDPLKVQNYRTLFKPSFLQSSPEKVASYGPENVSGKSPQQDIEIPNVPSLKSPEDVSDAYLQKDPLKVQNYGTLFEPSFLQSSPEKVASYGPENVSGKSPQQDIEISNVPSLKTPEDVSDAYLQKDPLKVQNYGTLFRPSFLQSSSEKAASFLPPSLSNMSSKSLPQDQGASEISSQTIGSEVVPTTSDKQNNPAINSDPIKNVQINPEAYFSKSSPIKASNENAMEKMALLKDSITPGADLRQDLQNILRVAVKQSGPEKLPADILPGENWTNKMTSTLLVRILQAIRDLRLTVGEIDEKVDGLVTKKSIQNNNNNNNMMRKGLNWFQRLINRGSDEPSDNSSGSSGGMFARDPVAGISLRFT